MGLFVDPAIVDIDYRLIIVSEQLLIADFRLSPSSDYRSPVVGKSILKSNYVTLLSLLLKETSYF
jgi:hypothetical protein